jgi:hypothetical protein
MRRDLETAILRMRGGQHLLNLLSNTFDKLSESDLESLWQLVQTAHEDGVEEGTRITKSKVRSRGFFI